MRISAIVVLTLAAFLLMGTSVTAEPNIVSCATPVVTVSGSIVSAVVCLQNTGTAMTESWLVEMSPRVRTGALSWVSSQMVCDTTYPQNVHREFTLGAGEQIPISLDVSVVGGAYDVFVLTADLCCPDNPDCQAKSPFGWGTYIGTVTVSGEPPVCGDGVCEGYETPGSCPEDCHGYCGDGFCEPSEQGVCDDCVGDIFKDIIDFVFTYYMYIIGIAVVVVGIIYWRKR